MKGYAAYAKVQPTKEGYRDLEYKVLGTVTGALIKASEPETELADKFNAVLWNEKVFSSQIILHLNNYLFRFFRKHQIGENSVDVCVEVTEEQPSNNSTSIDVVKETKF